MFKRSYSILVSWYENRQKENRRIAARHVFRENEWHDAEGRGGMIIGTQNSQNYWKLLSLCANTLCVR